MATRGKKTNRERIHPKLKMISDGDTYVNTLRAEHAAAIGISNSQVLKSVPLLRGDSAAPSDKVTAHRPPKKLRMVSPDTVVNVFVELQESSDPNEPVHGETDRVGTIATAQLSLNDLGNLLADERVTYVSLGEPLTPPRPSVATDDISAPTAATRGVPRANVHHQGANVLIGIIDVEGFDFAHPDFLDAGGNTRFERIWDQGGDARPSPHGNHNAGFDYGAEFTREVLDAALEAAPTIGVPATEIERQSQMAAGSHGTHVASIAAGNLGVCSRAVIAAVLLDLAEGDLDRRRSFYDSTRLAHAVAYLFALGEELGLPVSVNVSLGTNGHAHDASSPSSRWLDAALSVPSRAICVAAGNAGQEGPSGPGDFGFIMGRVHTSGRIAAAGLDVDLEWQVIGNTIADLSENELEIWYSAQDRFSVSVRTPAGQWIGPVSPGEFIENQQLPDATFISIYSELS